MTRFNTTEEVTQYAKKAAAHDLEMYINHNTDINPFCTVGARSTWDKGFNNTPLPSWDVDCAWSTIYQRGVEAALLMAVEGNMYE